MGAVKSGRYATLGGFDIGFAAAPIIVTLTLRGVKRPAGTKDWNATPLIVTGELATSARNGRAVGGDVGVRARHGGRAPGDAGGRSLRDRGDGDSDRNAGGDAEEIAGDQLKGIRWRWRQGSPG